MDRLQLPAQGPEFAGPNVSLAPTSAITPDMQRAAAQVAFWGARKSGNEAGMQEARESLTKAGGMTVEAMQLARKISASRR